MHQCETNINHYQLLQIMSDQLRYQLGCSAYEVIFNSETKYGYSSICYHFLLWHDNQYTALPEFVRHDSLWYKPM